MYIQLCDNYYLGRLDYDYEVTNIMIDLALRAQPNQIPYYYGTVWITGGGMGYPIDSGNSLADALESVNQIISDYATYVIDLDEIQANMDELRSLFNEIDVTRPLIKT